MIVAYRCDINWHALILTKFIWTIKEYLTLAKIEALSVFTLIIVFLFDHLKQGSWYFHKFLVDLSN